MAATTTDTALERRWPSTALRWIAGSDRKSTVDEEQLAHDLSLMLRSGLRLMDALHTLRERDARHTPAWLLTTLKALEQGRSFSAALTASACVGPAFLACVRASEATGDLGDSLNRFAVNAARLRVLRARLVSACVYPALLVAVASLVVLFLLVYVVPRFATVLEGTVRDMPWVSRLLIDVGVALSAVQGPLIGALLLGLLGAGVMLWRLARSGQLVERTIDTAARLPWMRDYLRAFGLAQIARSAAMLVRSGLPALKALELCRALLPGIDRPRLDAALAAARTGAPLARSLHESRLFDALAYRVLKVSEQSGQLDAALDRVADMVDSQLERALERLGRLIEPMLMLVIGTVVGGIVVMMYLPIFQLAASVR